MSHCVKEFPPLDVALQERIRDRIFADQAPSLPSLLYDTHDKSKIYNLERRSSAFRLFTDQELFKDCDALVALLSHQDPTFTYSLRHNDITHIHYEKDDFFEAHTDYLSVTSNHVQEFTLIMCLDATCQGKGGDGRPSGETRFTLNPFCSITSSSSVTPLHLVLFRKDITHEGLKLEEGTKDIITLNLWGMPSADNKDDKTLVISFPPDETRNFYALPWSLVDHFPHCFFHGWRAFSKKIKDEEEPDLLDYLCTVASYEEMKIIVDILHGVHIEMDVYLDHVALIKFFGFLKTDLLLEIPHIIKEHTPKETSLTLTSKDDKTKTLKIVFADSSSALKVLNKRIKEEGLNALTFSMAFYEGNYDIVKEEPPHLDDLDGSDLTFMCAEFGEARQLLSYHFPSRWGDKCLDVGHLIRVCGTADTQDMFLLDYNVEDLTAYFDDSSDDDDEISEPPVVVDDSKEESETSKKQSHDDKIKTFTMPRRGENGNNFYAARSKHELSLAYFENTSSLDFELLCGPHPDDGSLESACTRAFDNELVFCPPFEQYRVFAKCSDDDDYSLPYLIDPETNLAYLDPLRQEDLKLALEDFDVTNGILKALPSLALRFPQERINEAYGLCNETLYLNFSLVFVYGIMFFD